MASEGDTQSGQVIGFLEALRRELALCKRDAELDDARLAAGTYALAPIFNLSKHRNSELAWVLNTQNHEAQWPLWWTRGAAR